MADGYEIPGEDPDARRRRLVAEAKAQAATELLQREQAPPAQTPQEWGAAFQAETQRQQEAAAQRAAAQQAGLAPEDAALAQQAQLVDARLAAQQGQMLPGSQQALEGAYGGGMAQWQAGEEALARMQPFQVATPNVRAPIVKRAAREQLAGEGAPTARLPPFEMPERDPTESDAAYEMRVQLATEAYQAENADAIAAAQEQARIPTARDVGRPGEIGFIEAERRVGEKRTAAEMDLANIVARNEQEAAIAQRATIREQQEAMRERQQQMQDARDAVGRLSQVEQEARRKLEAIPAFNGQRKIQQMGTGMKILALVGSAAAGMGGDPRMIPDMIEQEIQRDNEEQRTNYEIGVRNYEAARDAVNQGMDIYASIRDGIGDEAAADQVYYNLQIEDAVQALREEASMAQLPAAKAQLEQAALELEQRLRARRDQTELAVATTPDKIVRTIDPFRHERQRLEKRQERIEKHLDDLEMKDIDVSAAREKAQADIALEREKFAGQRAMKREEIKAQTEKDIKNKSAAWGQVETMLDEFLASRPGEMYTVGIPGMGEKKQRIEEEQFFRLMPEILTTAVTGAVASPEQAETFRGLIEGDWLDMGDEDRRARLLALKNMAGAQRRGLQKELGPERPAVYDPTKEIGSFRAE